MQIGRADIGVPSWGNRDVVQDGRGGVALQLQAVFIFGEQGSAQRSLDKSVVFGFFV